MTLRQAEEFIRLSYSLGLADRVFTSHRESCSKHLCGYRSSTTEFYTYYVGCTTCIGETIKSLVDQLELPQESYIEGLE